MAQAQVRLMQRKGIMRGARPRNAPETVDLHRPVMSSMWSSTPRWNALVDSADASRVRGTLADHLFLWRISRGKQAVILLGSVTLRNRYRDLLFAMLLKLRRPRPLIVISDATWEPRSRVLERNLPWAESLLPAIIRMMVRAIDAENVRFCVLSSDELHTFPEAWGVHPERVIFTPFQASIPPDTPHRVGDYVFAGGNSLRDYAMLCNALSGADFPTVLRTDWRPDHTLPPGITVGRVSHDQFVRELAGCRVAVFPLINRVRSTGQQTYLNAMLMEKVVIATRAPGVEDYIRNGVTGIVVPPGTEALRQAIRHAMDPDNEPFYVRMRRAARESVLANFTAEVYMDCHLLGAAGFPCPEYSIRPPDTP